MIRSTIVLILMTVSCLGSSLEWNEHLRLKSRLVTSSERAAVTRLANQGDADAQYRLGLTLFTELDIENKIPIKLVVPNDRTYGGYSSIFGGSDGSDEKRIFQWNSLQYNLDLYATLASSGGAPNREAITKLASRYGMMCDPLGQGVFNVLKGGYTTRSQRKYGDTLITYESIMTDTFPIMILWMMKSAKQGHCEAMITMAMLMRTANFVREGWNIEGWCDLSRDKIDEEMDQFTKLCTKDGNFLSLSMAKDAVSLKEKQDKMLAPYDRVLQRHQEITSRKTMEIIEEASRIALQIENPEAYFKIGTLYAQPRFFYQTSDVRESDPLYNQALQWLERAAEKEHRYALRTLGTIYRDGEGVEKNLQRAANYFRQQIVVLKKEADSGNSDAQLTLANTYRSGFESFLPNTPAFLEKDLSKAVLYFEQSAAQGNLGAMNNIKELAAMWYGDGKQEAQAALGRLKSEASRAVESVTNGIELEVTENALRGSSNEQRLETTRKLKTSDNEVKRLISSYIKSLHYLGEPMSFGVCCIGMASLPHDREITDAQHNSNLWRITLCGPCLDCASNCLYMPFYSTCSSCVCNALSSPYDCMKHVIGSHRLSSSANQEQRKWIDSAVHLRGNPGALYLNTGVYAVSSLFRAPPPWWDFAQEGSLKEETWKV